MTAPSLVVSNLGARANPRVARRASSRARRVAPPRASGGERRQTIEESDASDASSGAAGRASSLPLGLTRRNLIDAAFVAVSIPLWKDIAHDLGYLQGPEDAPADLPVPPPGSGYVTATFSGGCFWCMERPFDELDGVIATTSGYTGGFVDNSTYHEVGAGRTGHRESVQILYDPRAVSYEQLLQTFWRQVDPTRDDGMFLDSGFQYTSAIYVADESQRAAAEESVRALTEEGRFPGPIKTAIEPASAFWPAEKYHQDYYRRNSTRYGFYRFLSGRDEFVRGVWGADGGARGRSIVLGT